MNAKLKSIIFSLTLCSTQLSYAESKIENNDAWQFTVAPYVWAMSLDGSLQIGNESAQVSQNFGDILRDLQWGGMLWTEAHKDKWGLFANLLYASLSQTDNENNITLKNNFGLFSAGASYDCFTKQINESQLTLSPYAGFRYTLNNAKLSATGISLSNDHSWVDPLAGARISYAINSVWSVIVAADAGGTSNTDYSYNAQGLVSYNIQRFNDMTLYAGYRLLNQYYVTGSGSNLFAWKMQFQGPLLGLAFNF